MNENNYPIETFVRSLFDDDKDKCIFHEENEYSIPIYQRPYSWNEDQISEFLETLLEDYTPGDSSGKPIFFGTMQFNLKDKKRTL